jgi:hypothetical protein
MIKLGEIHDNIRLRREFWDTLERNLVTEDNAKINSLLKKSHELIFKKFGIKPDEKKYFIGGSLRLHVFPKLLDALGIGSEIGDLDFIIPYEQLWVNAGLTEELEKGGIYRPTSDDSIEAFTIWDPSKAGAPFEDVNVDSTENILKRATIVGGYYVMSLYDVADYKLQTNREKEKEVVEYMQAYLNKKISEVSLFKKIIGSIGVKSTRELFTLTKDSNPNFDKLKKHINK